MEAPFRMGDAQRLSPIQREKRVKASNGVQRSDLLRDLGEQGKNESRKDAEEA